MNSQPTRRSKTLGLYDFQQEDAQKINEAFERVRRVLYTLPTGGGKTKVAAAIAIAALAQGKRVLFLAHRRELVNQAAARLRKDGVPAKSIGIVMGQDKRAREDAPVQVASIDTLRRRKHPPADIVIVDEAHRSLAVTYRKLLAVYPEAKVLGLTATPYRLDGKGLGQEYDEMVIGPAPEELITGGYLAAGCSTFTVPDELLPVLKGVRIKGGDYDQGQLGKEMSRRPLVASAVQEYRRLGDGLPAVVFCASREHARIMQEEFTTAGYSTEYLDGETGTRTRDAMLVRMREGKTQILVNCDVLVEGWDAPWVKCAVLARPTKSQGRYLQMVGRILRPWRRTAPVILDHAGNAIAHGLPDMDRRGEFTLDDRPKKNGRVREPLAKRCPECGLTSPTGTSVCPACGFEFPALTVPKTIDGELQEICRCEKCGGQVSTAKAKLCRKCWLAGQPGRLHPCKRCGHPTTSASGVCRHCISHQWDAKTCKVCKAQLGKHHAQKTGLCRKCINADRHTAALARSTCSVCGGHRNPRSARGICKSCLQQALLSRPKPKCSVCGKDICGKGKTGTCLACSMKKLWNEPAMKLVAIRKISPMSPPTIEEASS